MNVRAKKSKTASKSITPKVAKPSPSPVKKAPKPVAKKATAKAPVKTAVKATKAKTVAPKAVKAKVKPAPKTAPVKAASKKTKPVVAKPVAKKSTIKKATPKIAPKTVKPVKTATPKAKPAPTKTVAKKTTQAIRKKIMKPVAKKVVSTKKSAPAKKAVPTKKSASAKVKKVATSVKAKVTKKISAALPRDYVIDALWTLPSLEQAEALFGGWCKDPHAFLGMHQCDEGMSVRVFDPYASEIRILWGDQVVTMGRVGDIGLWTIGFPGVTKHFSYKIEKVFDHGAFVTEDPYCFQPQISDTDVYLFNEGTHENAYEFMGAHVRDVGGVPGVVFCLWAPNADRVSIVGDFNCWDGRRHPMRLMGQSGIWELFLPRMAEGEVYKYEIRAKNGDIFLKLDPFAFFAEKRPNNAGIIDNSAWRYEWTDAQWMKHREETNWRESPMNVYEIHLASWQHPNLRALNQDDESDLHNYREIAHVLADYVIEMGYTHIELMPILEHPLDISWGYQVSAYYAPTSRFGTPEDFAYFVNHMHSRGIGVLLDWVPAHFPKDAFSLGRFDGTALYEHADPRKGEHQDWGTYIFNYGRCEVQSFLMGNAFYWFDKFHIDGLRVDAVASMLYLDYSRKHGEWLPNQYGGNENIEAIEFMRRLNAATNRLFPGTLMIAEESTAWPGVSRPNYAGGLGFNFKWNMGWMHDVLSYFARDPIYRSYHQNDLTLPLLYFTTENFALPLSHDEVVHGKKSLLNKMPGDYWRKFANLRALYAWMTVHPGKKLLFMGGEFGQWIEWNCKKGLDWLLLAYESHCKLRNMVASLNHLYKKLPALWEDDFSVNGFQWIDASNYRDSIVAFLRWDKKRATPVLIVANLTPAPHEFYQIGVPFNEPWVEVFNTDAEQWGGSGVINTGPLPPLAKTEIFHGQYQSIELRLPPLGAAIFLPASQLGQLEE